MRTRHARLILSDTDSSQQTLSDGTLGVSDCSQTRRARSCQLGRRPFFGKVAIERVQGILKPFAVARQVENIRQHKGQSPAFQSKACVEFNVLAQLPTQPFQSRKNPEGMVLQRLLTHLSNLSGSDQLCNFSSIASIVAHVRMPYRPRFDSHVWATMIRGISPRNAIDAVLRPTFSAAAPLATSYDTCYCRLDCRTMFSLVRSVGGSTVNTNFSQSGMNDASPNFLFGGGEMGARIRAHDWSATPLGPPDAWPQSMRSALSICLNTSLVSAVHWGPELRILYNDAYIPTLAERHPWALGRPFHEVWAEIWDVLSPQIDSVLATGQGFSTEHQLLRMMHRGKPEDTWWIYSFAPIRAESGQVEGIFVTALETTDQVRADTKRRDSEDRLQMALSAGNSIGTWDWNVAEDRVTADERFASLYGVDPSKAAFGAPITEFFAAVHPDDLDSLRKEIETALKSGEPFSAENRLTQADGSVRWVTAQGKCMLDADGRPTRFPGVTFDITKRKSDEQHLQLVVHELNHRVKNTLATVQATASQTFRDPETIKQAQSDVSARLAALGKAHDVLTETSWTGANLRKVVMRTIEPHDTANQSRFTSTAPTFG